MTTPGPVAPSLPCCLRAVGSGCELLVQVVPGASRSAVAGVHDGALRIRIAAPAIDGRANHALLGWLAAQIGLPRRAFTLFAGETSRRKRIGIDAGADRVAPWIASLGIAGDPEGAAAPPVTPSARRGR